MGERRGIKYPSIRKREEILPVPIASLVTKEREVGSEPYM